MMHRNEHSSAIGWVDFSAEHREKVKSALDLLSTPGVVDELGIGVIRDSFSDSLFPGISTIQTRAKYFLTVPRIFEDYERLPAHRRRRRKLTAFLKEHENLCMEAMDGTAQIHERRAFAPCPHAKAGFVQSPCGRSRFHSEGGIGRTVTDLLDLSFRHSRYDSGGSLGATV
jgi:hypothetical protein